MSQAGSNSSSSGPPPPAVPVEFDTQVNSPAIPALNILIVNGGATSADNSNGIRSDGSSGSNTLTIQLTNRLSGTATVSGATTGDIITFALAASASAYRFNFLVCGISTAGVAVGQGVGYTIDGSARTDGATATIISTPDIDADEDTALTGSFIQLIASGNNIIVRATCIAGETINYKAVGTYVVVS